VRCRGTQLAWWTVADITNEGAALAAYRAMRPAELRRLLLVEDRCARGCLLVRVWQGAGRIYAYLPAYRLSAARNAATSDPGARSARTRDGERRWQDRVIPLDEMAGTHNIGVTLNCDHLASFFVSADELISRAQAAQPGQPDRRTREL
jgi:hypothetical protein